MVKKHVRESKGKSDISEVIRRRSGAIEELFLWLRSGFSNILTPMLLENNRDLDGRRVRLNQRERDELQEELKSEKDEDGTNTAWSEKLEHPV